MARKLLRNKLLLSLSLACFVLLLGGAGYFVFTKYRGLGALERAELAFAAGQWSEAKTNYTWYLVRHPKDPDVLPRYIESCLQLVTNRRANISDAGRGYLELALADRSNPDRMEQALAFYRKHGLWRELDYAASLFLREFPDDTNLVFSKALASDRLGRVGDATAGYASLIEAGTAAPEVYGNLALLYHQQSLDAQGRQLMDDALAKAPDDPRVRVERAKFELAANNVTNAAQEIETALAAGADTGEAYITAARVHTALHEWERAQTHAEQAIAANPESADGYTLVAQCMLARGHTDEAIAFLTAIDPLVKAENPQLFLMLAETQINADDLENADRTLEAFRAAHPDARDTFEYLAARRLWRAGDPARAAARLEILVEKAPAFLEARFALALAYLECGEFDRARNALELYMASNPGDSRARLVWDATFVQRSAREIEANAIALLDSDTPHFNSLLSAASSLERARLESDDGGKRRELLKSLYERAIDESPSAPDGYLRLAGLCIEEGAFERVRQLLDSAKATGVDDSTLAILRAALAFAESKPDAAAAELNDEFNRDAMTLQRAIQWAELFALRQSLQAGLDVLEAAKGRETDEVTQQELDLRQIMLCLNAGDVQRSRTVLEQLTERYTGDADMVPRLNDGRMNVARALLAPGGDRDQPAAEALLAVVESTEPGRSDVKIVRARLLLSQEPPDVDGAEALCAQLRRDGTEDAEALLISSEIAYRKSQFANALDFAQMANAAAPDDPRTALPLARAQVQAGRFTDAVMTLEKLEAAVPGDRAILDLLARAYAGAGRFQDAEAVAQRLAANDSAPSDPSLQAWILICREDWGRASDLLRQLHATNPDNMWSIHYLARAMEAQGRWDELEAFLNESVSRQPDSPHAWVELGNSYLAKPEPERLAKASFAFTQALVVQPDYLPALRGLLDVNLRSGELGAALGLCDRFLADNPNDPAMLEKKASLLARLPGRRQDALTAIQRAIEITPRPEFFYLRGRLRLDLGGYTAALEDFERVNQAGGLRSPGDVSWPSLEIAMAEAYLGLSSNDRALFYFESAKAKYESAKSTDVSTALAFAARLNEIEKRLEQKED